MQKSRVRPMRLLRNLSNTIIGFAMQNGLEGQNIALPHSILGRLRSEVAQMKPTYEHYQDIKKIPSNSVENKNGDTKCEDILIAEMSINCLIKRPVDSAYP
jgi:hypothetical protein